MTVGENRLISTPVYTWHSQHESHAVIIICYAGLEIGSNYDHQFICKSQDLFIDFHTSGTSFLKRWVLLSKKPQPVNSF